MRLKENNFLISNILLIFTVFICLVMGKFITAMPSIVPVIIIFGFFVFFLSIAATDLAMTLLIFAMLLSPELSFGEATRRSIVVRIEDLLIAVFSVTWLARTSIHGRMSFLPKTPLNKFIGFYVGIFILSTVIGMTSVRLRPLTGTFYILKYLEYFFVYYLVSGILKNKLQVKVYLKAFIITFAIVNIYAFTQITGGGRVSAPFEGTGEPNTLGGYQILILGVILGLLTHVRSMKWRWPLIGTALFSLVPFAFTLSRSSYMSIIPMYFTLIFFNKFKTRNTLIGVLIILVILSMFFFPKNIKERITYTFIPQVQEGIKTAEVAGIKLGPSASARVQDWSRLFEKWKKRPFIGYGITGVGFVDSQFIRTLVELGLMGFVAFAGLLVEVFRITLRIYKTAKDDWYKGLALGFLAGHIGMIFHATTANTFILIRVMEPYWFLAAMVMMIPKLEKMEEEKIKVETISKEPPEVSIRKTLPRNTEFLYGA